MAGEGSALLERASCRSELRTIPMRFSGLDFCNPFTLYRCAAIFRKNTISRVVLGLPADLKTAGLAAKLAGVEGIYYRRGIAVAVRNTLLNRYLYGRMITGLIVNSAETARLVFLNNPSLIDKSKVRIQHNGIAVADFDASYNAAAPLYRKEDDTLLIGNAGRLTKQKGQHYLLYMSRALLDAGVRHRLILAGEGELREDLSTLAERLDLAKTVEFTGFLPNMAPFWRSIDIFVLSSLWEGFGYVLAEALLAQKPVLAFNGNSMPEVVQNGKTGMLIPFPASDEEASAVGKRLAQSVRLLAEQKHEWARMGIAARKFCIQLCDGEILMDRLFSLLWPQ